MINLKSYLQVKLVVKDFNNIMTNPNLLKKLRTLTLNPGSGMSNELNNFTWIVKERPVNAKAILAYKKEELIGWALLSKEPSAYCFNFQLGFTPADGTMLQIYVLPEHRRTGVGSRLIRRAKQQSGQSTLCIVPWNPTSEAFYKNFKHYKHKAM